VFHKLRNLTLLSGIFALGLACSAKTSGPSAIEDAGVPGGADAAIPTDDFAISNLARVRFKRSDRLRESLSRALDLDPATMCFEFEDKPCIKFHEIALGGVEAYDLTIYEQSETTGLTAPIVIQRILLSTCQKRVDLDLANSSAAVIFGELELTPEGGLADVTAQNVRDTVELLYRRFLSRNATPEEIDRFVNFYTEVEADSSSTKARDWAILSCYIVGSSLEWLFY